MPTQSTIRNAMVLASQALAVGIFLLDVLIALESPVKRPAWRVLSGNGTRGGIK